MKRVLYVIFSFSLLLSFFLFPLSTSFAAMSNCAVVKVGNPSGTPALPPECSTGGGGGDATACSYMGRGGLKKPGNPELARFANETANKLSVPGAVVLGIMRIETDSAFSSTDKTYFTNDYDANPSAGAIGIMQFLPSTFEWTFQANQKEMQSIFSKTNLIKEIHPLLNLLHQIIFFASQVFVIPLSQQPLK